MGIFGGGGSSSSSSEPERKNEPGDRTNTPAVLESTVQRNRSRRGQRSSILASALAPSSAGRQTLG